MSHYVRTFRLYITAAYSALTPHAFSNTAFLLIPEMSSILGALCISLTKGCMFQQGQQDQIHSSLHLARSQVKFALLVAVVVMHFIKLVNDLHANLKR